MDRTPYPHPQTVLPRRDSWKFNKHILYQILVTYNFLFFNSFLTTQRCEVSNFCGRVRTNGRKLSRSASKGEYGNCRAALTAAPSVLTQFVFEVAVPLSNRSAHLIIKIRREFFHAVNSPSMLQDLLKESCLRLRTSCKSAPRLQIFPTNHFVHITRTSLLIKRITITFQDSRAI